MYCNMEPKFTDIHRQSLTIVPDCIMTPLRGGRFSEGNWATENPTLLGESYTEGVGSWVRARIDYRYIYPATNEYYNVDTTHYVIEWYQQYNCFGGSCGYYWYDPRGFGFLPGTGGPTYPVTGTVGYWTSIRRRVGSTFPTIRYQGRFDVP